MATPGRCMFSYFWLKFLNISTFLRWIFFLFFATLWKLYCLTFWSGKKSRSFRRFCQYYVICHFSKYILLALTYFNKYRVFDNLVPRVSLSIVVEKRPWFTLVTCHPESGRFAKCVLGEGWQCRPCRHCEEGNQHAIDLVAWWPSTKRLTTVFYVLHIRNSTWKWSNRSDATESILASFKFSPVFKSGSTKNANSLRQF